MPKRIPGSLKRRLDLFSIIGILLILIWLLDVYTNLFILRKGFARIFYFCSVTLLLSGIGFIRRSRLILSTQLLAAFTYHLVWNIDLVMHLAGSSFTGNAAYMFEGNRFFLQNFLSVSHIYMVPLLIYGLYKLGSYDALAWRFASLQIAVLNACAFIIGTPEDNVNYVYGFFWERTAQQVMHPIIFVVVLTAAEIVVVFVPLNYAFAALSGWRSAHRKRRTGRQDAS
jgi:hypothetical protein